MAITIPIISEFNDKGTKQAEGALSGLSKSAKVAGTAMAASFAAVAAGLTMAVKAAAEDQASFQQLAVTLKNVTGASDQVAQAVDKQLGKMSMASGIADDKLRPALSNLVRATGDLKLSQGALGSVMDLSVAKQIDMESASAAVGKALAGNTTALVKMLPGLKGVIDNGSSAAEILQAINDQVGGASAAQADTFAGKIGRMKIVFGELVETVGSWLLPLLTNLADFVLQKLIPAFGFISDTVGPQVEGALGRISELVQKYLVPAFEWWTNMLRDNIIPIISTMVGVLRDNLVKVFNVVRDKIDANRDAFIKMRDNIETVIVVFKEKALPILTRVAEFMGTVGAKAIGVFIDAIIKVGSVMSGVAAGVSRVFSSMVDSVTKGINLAIDAINMLITGWNAIPDWAKPGGDISLIPKIGSGGLGGTTSGGMGIWGENRGAMGPSLSIGGIASAIGGATGGSMGGSSGGTAAGGVSGGIGPGEGGGGWASGGFGDIGMGWDLSAIPIASMPGDQNIIINVNSTVADASLPEMLVGALRDYNRTNGPLRVQVA